MSHGAPAAQARRAARRVRTARSAHVRTIRARICLQSLSLNYYKMSDSLSLSSAFSSLLALLRKPSVALVLSNTVTAGVLLYALSEGRPLRALRRLLWRAALAAVPRSLVDRELGSIKRKLERDLIGSTLDGESLVLALPDAGWPRAAVGETLARYGAADAALWRSGRISGCVYHGGDDLADVQTDAFRLYAISNPLHPDVFPRLRKVRGGAAARAKKN